MKIKKASLIIKIKSNIKIYKKDVQEKGLYWSIVHRLFKIPGFKKMLSPIVDMLKPSVINFDGFKLYIDRNDKVVSQYILERGGWEEYERSLFKKNIKSGDVVVDIGAHIGIYTLTAARKVGRKGVVYAFEPDQNN